MTIQARMTILFFEWHNRNHISPMKGMNESFQILFTHRDKLQTFNMLCQKEKYSFDQQIPSDGWKQRKVTKISQGKDDLSARKF